jgi:hypothetical protein
MSREHTLYDSEDKTISFLVLIPVFVFSTLFEISSELVSFLTDTPVA